MPVAIPVSDGEGSAGGSLDMTAIIHSSASTEWATPQWFVDRLAEEFAPGGFDLDPAARDWSAKAPVYYSLDRGEDGLELPWFGNVWVNPPYGRGKIGWRWLSKMVHEVTEGAAELVVALMPARTDTAWWHELVMPNAAEIRLVCGRLTFEREDGATQHGATFPSAILVFRRRLPWLTTRQIILSSMGNTPASRCPSPEESAIEEL